MRRATHRTAAALAAMAAWHPGAPGNNYPNQRSVNDPYVAALRDASIDFWAKRGVTVPATTKIDVADDLQTPGDAADQLGAQGRGWGKDLDPTGRLVLEGRNLGIELRRIHSKRLPASTRRLALDRLAKIVFHEMGHDGGKAHTATGLMSEHAGEEVPWEARVLARRLIPKPRR